MITPRKGRRRGHEPAAAAPRPLPGTTPSPAQDLGEPDAALAAALAAGDIARVLSLLPAVRLLIPVVALPGSGGAEMAVPELVNAAGRRALPVFTGLDALHAWRRDARPVPMSGARVLAAAVAEDYDGVVLDVAGPQSCTLDRDVLPALAPRPTE